MLILGTGLTMVDYVLALLREGHADRSSRCRAAACCPRRTAQVALSFDDAEVPFGRERRARCCAGFAALARQARRRRRLAQRHRRASAPIRSHLARAAARIRRRFLEHARAWWDTHRHRMAPEVEAMRRRRSRTHLTLMAAKMVDIYATPLEQGCAIAAVAEPRSRASRLAPSSIVPGSSRIPAQPAIRPYAACSIKAWRASIHSYRP